MSAESFRRRLSWIAGHWSVYRSELPWLLSLTIINAGVAVGFPFLIKRVIDGVADAATPGYVLRSSALLLGIGLLHFGLYFVVQFMRTRLNLRFQFGIRLRAFEQLTRLGPAFFGRFRTGDLITRLNDDVNDKLSWYMCSGIFRVIEALAIIAWTTGAMVWINPRLAFYMAAPLPLLILLFIGTATRLHRRYEVVQRSISRLNDVLESCFSGIRVVKAFAAETQQQALVEEAIEENRRAEVRAVRWQTVIDSLYSNVWQLALVWLLLAGGTLAIAGQVTVGALLALQAYVQMLVYPMFDIGQFLVRGRLSAVSIERLGEVEATVPEVEVAGEAPPVARRPDAPLIADYARASEIGGGLEVQFRGVTYRYPGSPADALCDVTFAARPGELTAVAGGTGAGKSTVLALAPRLIDPTAGAALAGGTDLRRWDLIQLRQAIGYVPQEPLLLSGTVLENIRFGRVWITDADIAQALEICQLRDDITRWPNGLATVVGSRGMRLSGGQKQRVSLARAVAGRPRLLLLDDCTASLDAETEAAVWERLFTALPGCTTLLVTHRPATLRRAARILVLDAGRLAQQGTFGEVDVPGSVFHRIYSEWQEREGSVIK
ncbi:MAG: ABC transporter ATP-binding protein/permease [Planctomycetia bacterium]|nr:ABC transporter ATP-binding protein/permease [Planctomycetia bacterium]